MIYLEESYTLHYSKGINIKISAYHSEKEESDIENDDHQNNSNNDITSDVDNGNDQNNYNSDNDGNNINGPSLIKVP